MPFPRRASGRRTGKGCFFILPCVGFVCKVCRNQPPERGQRQAINNGILDMAEKSRKEGENKKYPPKNQKLPHFGGRRILLYYKQQKPYGQKAARKKERRKSINDVEIQEATDADGVFGDGKRPVAECFQRLRRSRRHGRNRRKCGGHLHHCVGRGEDPHHLLDHPAP